MMHHTWIKHNSESNVAPIWRSNREAGQQLAASPHLATNDTFQSDWLASSTFQLVSWNWLGAILSVINSKPAIKQQRFHSSINCNAKAILTTRTHIHKVDVCKRQWDAIAQAFAAEFQKPLSLCVAAAAQPLLKVADTTTSTFDFNLLGKCNQSLVNWVHGVNGNSNY